jgi:hypothetical protein
VSYYIETHRKERLYRRSGIFVFGPDPYVTKAEVVMVATFVIASRIGL